MKVEQLPLVDPNQLIRKDYLRMIRERYPEMRPEAVEFEADKAMGLQRGLSDEMARYEARTLSWERLIGQG